MEAWIETPHGTTSYRRIPVASHVEAWIETDKILYQLNRFLVASHVEAWIETFDKFKRLLAVAVASHVEAWIETSKILKAYKSLRSPPTWRRGLKLLVFEVVIAADSRLPRGGVD